MRELLVGNAHIRMKKKTPKSASSIIIATWLDELHALRRKIRHRKTASIIGNCATHCQRSVQQFLHPFANLPVKMYSQPMIVCCQNASLYSMLISLLFRSCATLFSSLLPSSYPSHASPWWVLSLCNAGSIPASIRYNSPFGSC